RQRAAARRIDVEDLLVEADGLTGLVEGVAVNGGHLREELLLLDRIGRLVLATAQDSDEITPPFRVSIERLERAEALEVRRIELEHPQICTDGAIDVAKLLTVNTGGLDPERPREVDVLGGLGQLLDELRQRRELLLVEG